MGDDTDQRFGTASVANGVRSLAGAIHAALTDSTRDTPIDEPLATFAITRHRVGPMLHMGVERNAFAAKADAAAILARDWLANRARTHSIALTTARVGQALTSHGVGYVAFKGVALAQALYPTPYWRHCGDTDILVSSGTLERASHALAAVGLACTDPVFFLPAPFQRFAMRVVRDVCIEDEQLKHKIELHSRLLFSKAISERLLSLEPTFRPRAPKQANDPPVPAIGSGYAAYLLMHGSMSGWSRLKWIVDILRVLQMLSPQSLKDIATFAEDAGVAKALKASLILVRAVFPAIELGPLQQWLAEPTAQNSIRRRVTAYASWLNAPSDKMPNPLHTRTAALESALLLVDGAGTKVQTLLSGAAASSLRIAAQASKSGSTRSSP